MNVAAVVVVFMILFVIITVSGTLMYLKMKRDWESKLEDQDREIMRQSVTLMVQERESCMRQKLNVQKHTKLTKETIILDHNVHKFLENTASNLYENQIPQQQRNTDNVRNKIIDTNARDKQVYMRNNANISMLGDRSNRTLYNFVELDKYVKKLNADIHKLSKRVDDVLARVTHLQPLVQQATVNPRRLKQYKVLVDELQSELKELQVRVDIVHEMQQAESENIGLVKPERVDAQEREINRISQEMVAAQGGMSKIISPSGTDLIQSKLNEISSRINEFEVLINVPTKSLSRCAGSVCIDEDQFKKLTSTSQV
jgi:hypothetical protein